MPPAPWPAAITPATCIAGPGLRDRPALARQGRDRLAWIEGLLVVSIFRHLGVTAVHDVAGP